MTEVVIRLDPSKPYSECRGERTPDDPHYRVHNWQGTKLKNGVMVLLPFDSLGVLVPDDGRTEAYQGLNVDGKMVTHHPLYTKAMRELVELKKKKLSTPAVEQSAEEPAALAEDDGEGVSPDDDVNFASWLRGEAQYEWLTLQKAARKRYSRVFPNKKAMVEDLVLDERVVPEDQVCRDLAKHLPGKAA